jgi:aryl-alcohol dehydrogenase-like predicted oxidoreductase
MIYRPLADTGLRVSAIGLGCSRLGGTVERRDDAAARRLLLHAHERGINFFDTADIYAQGNSERLLGNTFFDRRDSVIIATKAGYRLSSTGNWMARLKPLARGLLRVLPSLRRSVQKVRSSQVAQEFSAPYLRLAIHRSLKRLSTTYLDLFLLHNPPEEVLRSGEAFELLESLKQDGLIRCYGVSCRRPGDASIARAHSGIGALEVEVNLLEQDALRDLRGLDDSTMALIGRQPLASGWLARSPEVGVGGPQDLSPDEYQRRVQLVMRYQEVLRAHQQSLAEGALRFALRLEQLTCVVLGVSTVAHLDEALAVAAAPPLSAETMARLQSVRA